MLPVAVAEMVTAGGEAVGATVGPPAPASLSSIAAYCGLLKAPQAQFGRRPCVAGRNTALRRHLEKKKKQRDNFPSRKRRYFTADRI